MSLSTVKLRRDLRASWPRFVLMVFAIAVCLMAFGGILAAWAVVGRETGSAYLSTEPASATIVLDEPVDAERMAAIADQARQRPGVLQATGRTQFDTGVQVNGRPRDLRLQTFVAAADDPMRVARFDVGQEGSWPPAPGEILLGRDSLALLGIAVGDTVTIEPPGSEPLRLRVAGTVYDPSLAPSPQYQKGHAYLSASSLATARFDQLKIQVADPAGPRVASDDRAEVVAVAGEVGSWLGRDYDVDVAEIQVPTPYAHPHQWQADVLLLSLMAGGAAALLLATILVAAMLNNLFTRQIPQIGIMKAVGARSGRIARLYLAMTFSVAAAATALAIAPAIFLARDRVGGLLTMLGIEPVSLTAPWWAYAVIVAVGLGLPPLLTLPPLVRASRTTVRAAIDHHGGATKPSAASGVLARLSRLPCLDRGVLMALRNTVRRPARFWLSVGLLASAGTVFVAGMSLRSGTEAEDGERLAQRYWDVDVALDRSAGDGHVTAAVRRIPDVTEVQAWRQVQIGIAETGKLPFTRTYPDQGHGSITLNTLPTKSTLVEGRRPRDGETGVVVLDQAARDKTVPGLGPGDAVRLFIDGTPTTWRIAGIAEGGGEGSGVYATAAGFADATGQPQVVNRLRIITTSHDERTRQTVAAAVDRTLTGAGLTVGSSQSVSRGSTASSEHLGPVLGVLLVIALPLGLVGGIGLAATMGANVLDRFREFGIMHAIGARPRAVRRIVVVEGTFLAVASCLVAAIPTLLLTLVLGYGLGNLFGNAALPYRISPLAVGIWVAVVLLGAALATDAAATRASRITVREALTYL
ncbi:MAG: FtsX-like permease family protein [Streptosporangiales bacterium]|nr:FtsX-like permease family protein [Streptosporangiales bacterium]